MDQLMLSREARENTQVTEIVDRVNDVLYATEGPASAAISPNIYIPNTSDDKASLDAEIGEFYQSSDFFASLSIEEKREAYRALLLGEESEWSFGVQVLPGVNLFGERDEIAMQTVRVSRLGRYVLSGAVGAELLAADPELIDIAPDNLRPLHRAIYVGGVAAASVHTVYREQTFSGVRYARSGVSGEAYITRIGADLHGDFRTSRQVVPEEVAIDPFGRRWPFSGETSVENVQAYHSVEPRVLAALLRYQFGYEQRSPQAIYDRLMSRLSWVSTVGSGARHFADYDESSSDYIAHHIHDQLSERHGQPVAPGEYLESVIVSPGEYDYCMTLQATKAGVRVMNHDSEKVDAEFMISSDEIDDYIVALLSSAHGRTAPEALRSILEALRDPES